MLKDAALAEINSVLPLLEAIDTDVHISYRDFKYHLLPLLENIGEDFDVTTWIKNVTHPACAVIVHDDKDTDKVLYTIPPLFEATELNKPSFSLATFSGNLKNIVSDNPRNADDIFYNHLSAFKGKDEHGMQSAIEMAIALNVVFKDHKMPLLPLPKDVANEIAPVADEPEIEGYDLP